MATTDLLIGGDTAGAFDGAQGDLGFASAERVQALAGLAPAVIAERRQPPQSGMGAGEPALDGPGRVLRSKCQRSAT